MWVFNLLNLFLLHEVVIKLLCCSPLTLCLLVVFFNFLVFKYVVHCFCFYLMKSARCNGRNVALSFSLINILRLLLFVEVLLASDSTRRTNEF